MIILSRIKKNFFLIIIIICLMGCSFIKENDVVDHAENKEEHKESDFSTSMALEEQPNEWIYDFLIRPGIQYEANVKFEYDNLPGVSLYMTCQNVNNELNLTFKNDLFYSSYLSKQGTTYYLDHLAKTISFEEIFNQLYYLNLQNEFRYSKVLYNKIVDYNAETKTRVYELFNENYTSKHYFDVGSGKLLKSVFNRKNMRVTLDIKNISSIKPEEVNDYSFEIPQDYRHVDETIEFIDYELLNRISIMERLPNNFPIDIIPDIFSMHLKQVTTNIDENESANIEIKLQSKENIENLKTTFNSAFEKNPRYNLEESQGEDGELYLFNINCDLSINDYERLSIVVSQDELKTNRDVTIIITKRENMQQIN